MTNTFQILTKFLEQFGREVEGRELQQPTEDTIIKLKELARGNLAEAEWTALFGLLDENPQCVTLLADEIKSLRSADA